MGSGDDEVVLDSADVGVDQSTEGHVHRRAALKAALGGAAAGVAWSAPRIEGLSISPDYAQAASCVGANVIFTKNANDDCCGNQECWGNGSCFACTGNGCGNAGYNFNVAPKPFVISGNINGSCNGDDGRINITVNGIDPPFQRCTVNVTGNCNDSGSFRTNGGSVFNNNGTVNNILVDCQGGGGCWQPDPTGQIILNVTCVCL